MLRFVKLQNRTSKCFVIRQKRRAIHQLAVTKEYEVKYPPIIDCTLEGKLRHKRQLWHDSLKGLPTVEQKLYEMVTKHDYYSRVYFMSGCAPTYLGVPYQQYITRTHLIQELPQKFQALNIDDTYLAMKDIMCDAIANSLSNVWREEKLVDWSESLTAKDSGRRTIDELLSLCFRSLAYKHPHLLETTIDKKSDVSSYWYRGGFKSKKDYIIPEDLFKSPLRPWKKETIGINKQMAAENLCFQFKEQPYYSMRISKPLPPIVPLNDALCSTAEVVDYNYLPKVFGIPYKQRYYIHCLPGVWPGDPYEFPFLQIHTMDKMKKLISKLEHFNVDDIEDGFGVMASFGWLNGLAMYQGFTPYHDLTYPLVGQTILTNGQDWKFFIYQLNTICFHADVDNKDKRNLCWSSGKMKLFETAENGALKGVNDDVLKTLLKFLLHVPEMSHSLQLKPYLGEDLRTEEEIQTLHQDLQKLYRNAFNPKAYLEEIPMWQHVYKRHPDAPPSPHIRLQ